MRFKVLQDVSHEQYDPVLGRIDERFEAGVVSPKNEQQEAALTKLVDQGFAELVDDATPSYRKRALEEQANAEASAAATTEEPAAAAEPPARKKPARRKAR